jgi:hypothetical protein
MSKVGGNIITAADSISQAHFLNVFTGKTEPYHSHAQAMGSSLAAAARRIDELEREIAEIRSFLVMD